MRAREFITEKTMQDQTGEIASLIIFLRNRAEQEDIDPKINIEAFINMAQDMNISLSPDVLKDLCDSNEMIKNLIDNIDDDLITIKSNSNTSSDDEEDDEKSDEENPEDMELDGFEGPEDLGGPMGPGGPGPSMGGGGPGFGGGGFGGGFAPPAVQQPQGDPSAAFGGTEQNPAATIDQMAKRAMHKRV